MQQCCPHNIHHFLERAGCRAPRPRPRHISFCATHMNLETRLLYGDMKIVWSWSVVTEARNRVNLLLITFLHSSRKKRSTFFLPSLIKSKF